MNNEVDPVITTSFNYDTYYPRNIVIAFSSVKFIH